MERIKNQLHFTGLYTMDPVGLSGGLALMWRIGWDVEVLESSRSFVHTRILDAGSDKTWEHTFVYGDPVPARRRGLWPKLPGLRPRVAMSWFCAKDFNGILLPRENDGMRPPVRSRIQRFREFLHHSELMDLDLKGCRCTWHSNPRDGFVTRECID